jgi:cell division protein FtsQ
MPAVIRSPAKGRGGAKRQGYSPAKLKSAGLVGLDPRAALWVAFGLLILVLALTLATGGRLQHLVGLAGGGVAHRLGGAGFRVSRVSVEGGSPLSNADVLRAAAAPKGASILAVNLEEVRERVEQVGWVKSAKVIRLLPDTLVIAVTERVRLAVWQRGGQTSVVDKDGQIIPEADPGAFADLPLIVGDGANETAAGILPELAARPAMMARLEALVRVDSRRWDLKLKDGGLIQLPAGREENALIQFDQLDQKSHLLERGFERVDLRDPEMVAVRPKAAPQTSVAVRAPATAPA